MKKRPAYSNGYNKNQLIQIIDKIDAGKSPLKNRNENADPATGNNRTYFSGDGVKPDK
jgi:hypothetical protein